jgi:cell division protein ZapA (FtsZ GTPase activity inhibitor)
MRERWLELCAAVAIEEDPDHLKQLAQEINRLLEGEEIRLQQQYFKLRA